MLLLLLVLVFCEASKVVLGAPKQREVPNDVCFEIAFLGPVYHWYLCLSGGMIERILVDIPRSWTDWLRLMTGSFLSSLGRVDVLVGFVTCNGLELALPHAVTSLHHRHSSHRQPQAGSL